MCRSNKILYSLLIFVGFGLAACSPASECSKKGGEPVYYNKPSGIGSDYTREYSYCRLPPVQNSGNGSGSAR